MDQGNMLNNLTDEQMQNNIFFSLAACKGCSNKTTELPSNLYSLFLFILQK